MLSAAFWLFKLRIGFVRRTLSILCVIDYNFGVFGMVRTGKQLKI